jgi:Fe2+ transport system protein FeoA
MPSVATLESLKPGTAAVIVQVHAVDQPVCLRLQELGLLPGTSVLVLANQGGLVLRIGDQRLCLAEGLARAVEVLAL